MRAKPPLPITDRPPPIVDPNAVYLIPQAQAVLALGEHSLRCEVRAGRLRCSKRCGRYFVLGRWLIEWLEGGEVSRYRKHHEHNGRRAG